MKMLEDLEEVVRLRLRANQERAALDFIRTHQATIRDMAARLEAAERDVAIGRYVIKRSEWIRDEDSTLMAIRLPERTDLSSAGMRRDAITKAMQETGR